ncbi:MAG: electron transfer flavoprotein subunit beta/FixA family protein [Actinobacteria bacterium]|nr:electron transfer flavoprotein subunit beta/FixA family protein [Actinomycetota bacterium]
MTRIIVCCIKQVPGTTEIKIDPTTNTLIREGVESIINPLDTYALEEAVRIKERATTDELLGRDDFKVFAISMGPPQAEKALRESISLGADEAVLISDRRFAGADTLATSRTLASTIRKIENDFGKIFIVLCGKQTVDGDTGQVGPETAHFLNYPFLGYVSNIKELALKKLTSSRIIDDKTQTLEVPLPAVISVSKEINIPRIPSLKASIRSRTAQIINYSLDDIGLSEKDVGLQGSATQVIKIFTPKREQRAVIFSGDLEEQVEQLFKYLKDDKVI